MTITINPQDSTAMRKVFKEEADRRYPGDSEDLALAMVEVNRFHGFMDAENWIEKLIRDGDAELHIPLGTSVVFTDAAGQDVLRVTAEPHRREGLVLSLRSSMLVQQNAQEWVHPDGGETV